MKAFLLGGITGALVALFPHAALWALLVFALLDIVAMIGLLVLIAWLHLGERTEEKGGAL